LFLHWKFKRYSQLCSSYFALKLTVNNLQNCLSAYSNLLPKVLEAATAMALVDEDNAIEELGLIDELLEDNAGVVGSNLQLTITACMQIGLNPAFSDAVRVKGVLLTGWIARSRKKVTYKFIETANFSLINFFKAFLKQGLLQPTLEALFQLMSAPSSMEEEEEAFFASDVESTTPQLCASQTLDTLALSLPPDKLIPLLVQY
jgi:importin-4